MITVTEKALVALGFNPTSPLHAVQHVRTSITGDDVHVVGHKGVDLVNQLLGTTLSHADFFHEGADLAQDLREQYELFVAQAVAETVVKNVGVAVDEADVLANSKARAMRLLTSPEHKWLFAKKAATVEQGVQVAVVKDIDVTVAVKADGKIKKGGKEVLAAELYKKHVVEAAQPLDNQGFIKILMKELGMSKAGATTYNYNMKKKFGGAIVAKAKKGKTK